MFDLDWNSVLVGAAIMGLVASFDMKSKPSRASIWAFLVFGIAMLYNFISAGYETGSLLLAILFGRFVWLAWKK